MKHPYPTMICDTPTHTVFRDDKLQMEVVIAKDAVIDGNTIYTIPGRASLSTWLLDALQKRALYATRLNYAGKEGVLRRSPLSQFENEIRERGYMRIPMEMLPFRLLLRNAKGDKYRPVASVAFLDADGTKITPSLTDDELSAIVRPAIELMVSLTNRYASIGLTLNSAVIEMGGNEKRQYRACNFPGLPETAEITGANGEPYDYRLLQEGHTDLFLERYREICRAFGLTNIPGLHTRPEETTFPTSQALSGVAPWAPEGRIESWLTETDCRKEPDNSIS